MEPISDFHEFTRLVFWSRAHSTRCMHLKTHYCLSRFPIQFNCILIWRYFKDFSFNRIKLCFHQPHLSYLFDVCDDKMFLNVDPMLCKFYLRIECLGDSLLKDWHTPIYTQDVKKGNICNVREKFYMKTMGWSKYVLTKGPL